MVFVCPKCERRGPVAEPQMSVRVMIPALGRFGISAREKTNILERAWAQYREQHDLDLYGKSLLAQLRHGSAGLANFGVDCRQNCCRISASIAESACSADPPS